MTNDIWVWHYELTSATGLNSASQKTNHPGALIRIGAGYGCVHPWPELGDAPLHDQFKSLIDDHPTQLAAISKDCARLDGEARTRGENIYAQVDSSIPESHWLYLEGDDISAIREKGFLTAKLKIGPGNPGTEIIQLMAKEGLKIRLDANSTFQFNQFMEWWQSIPEPNREQIEFVEDPIPWNWWNWHCLEQSGVPLAVDREVENHPLQCPWAIFKPSVNLEESILPAVKDRGIKLAVTSYMDHPLGQMWAAFHAQLLNAGEPEWLGVCGLLTHRCFEETEFSEQIRAEGSMLQPPEGTGLGFDDLLEALPWKRLT